LQATAGSALSAVPVTAGVAQASGRHGGEHHGHRARNRVALPAGLRPEGITSSGSAYFVGSLADGRILTGDLLRGEPSTLLPGAAGRQVRGLYYDHRSRLVWAVGNLGDVAHIWAVRSRTGDVVEDVVVPGARFLNDLVVTKRSV